MRATSRPMPAELASLRRSWIQAKPPGFSTRCISAMALTGSLKFLNAAWQKTASKRDASNGMAEALPW